MKLLSRKFLLTLFSLLLVSVFSLLGIKYTIIQSLLSVFISGVLGILSLYFGGNITSKWVNNKFPLPELLVNKKGGKNESE